MSPPQEIFRPHAWSGFGTSDPEGADYRACRGLSPALPVTAREEGW